MKRTVKTAVLSTLVLASIGMSTSFADIFYWDGGASGEWNTTSKTWRKGTPDGSQQAWVNGNSAIFPDKAEITLKENITLSYPKDDKEKVALVCRKGGVMIKGDATLTFSLQDGNTFVANYHSPGVLTIDAPVVLKSESGAPGEFQFRSNIILNGKVSDGGVKHTLAAVFESVTLNNANELTGTVSSSLHPGSKLLIANDKALGSAVLLWRGVIEAANGNRTLANTIQWQWNVTQPVEGKDNIHFTAPQTFMNGHEQKKPTFTVAGPGNLVFYKVSSSADYGGGFVKDGNGGMIIKEYDNAKNSVSVDLKGGTLELGNIAKDEIMATGAITFGKSK